MATLAKTCLKTQDSNLVPKRRETWTWEIRTDGGILSGYADFGVSIAYLKQEMNLQDRPGSRQIHVSRRTLCTVVTAHTHIVPYLLLAVQSRVQSREDVEQLLMQYFLQAYEGFRVSCMERELVNKARFTDNPFLFTFEG